MGTADNTAHREPWNKGKIVGQKVVHYQQVDCFPALLEATSVN